MSNSLFLALLAYLAVRLIFCASSYRIGISDDTLYQDLKETMRKKGVRIVSGL